MDENRCKEKHIRVDEKLIDHERRIDSHGIRLDKLEVFSNVLEERLDNLIKQLSSLNTTIKWFIGLMIGAFISFFFYVIQQNIIK